MRSSIFARRVAICKIRHMASIDNIPEKLAFAAVITVISWLISRLMSRRNAKGRCATCGNTMDIYSMAQDGFRGDSFDHCAPCARKIRFVRRSIFFLILALALTTIYFTFA